MPIACDLNMELYLVPKQWVKEHVDAAFADFCYQLLKRYFCKSSLIARTGYSESQKAINQVIQILQNQKTTVRENIEAERMEAFKKWKIRSSDNSAMWAEIFYYDLKNKF